VSNPAGDTAPIALRSPGGARAQMYHQGAHVTSWIPADGRGERLFLSRTSEFRPGVAIRGGVPVIFPQFASLGPLAKHGFARLSLWRVVPDDATSTAYSARMRLEDTDATRAIWPYAFATELRVTLADRAIELQFSVENRGERAFTFTGALHTYLRVNDVRHTTVHGLQGARVRPSAGGREWTEADDALDVQGELDRVYLDVPRPVEVREPGRSVRVSATGFSDVVLWNPGPVRGAQLHDLEPDGFLRMLCVEAAVVETPIHVEAGSSWRGGQKLEVLL
jgi:glucose-6-phosphate 1-epimerase